MVPILVKAKQIQIVNCSEKIQVIHTIKILILFGVFLHKFRDSIKCLKLYKLSWTNCGFKFFRDWSSFPESKSWITPYFTTLNPYEQFILSNMIQSTIESILKQWILQAFLHFKRFSFNMFLFLVFSLGWLPLHQLIKLERIKHGNYPCMNLTENLKKSSLMIRRSKFLLERCTVNSCVQYVWISSRRPWPRKNVYIDFVPNVS